MRAYTVSYQMTLCGEVKQISFLAGTKAAAMKKAAYELIPKKEGSIPHVAWVSSVTYQNGNYKTF